MRLDALIIYSPEHAFLVHPMVAADDVNFSLKGRKSTNYFLSDSSHFVTIPLLSSKRHEKILS